MLAKSHDLKHPALKPFLFHGVKFAEIKHAQGVGDCPFCGKQSHFYVNLEQHENKKKIDPKTKKPYIVEAGAWNCQRCSKSGGVLQFLALLYGMFLAKTETTHYKALSAERDNLPWEAFRDARLAYDSDRTRPRWLIPLYDFTGKLKNLYAWTGKGSGLMGTTGQETSLYYPTDPSIPPPKMPKDWPIIVCEGEWDAIALAYLRTKAGKSKKTMPPAIVLAVHGASQFDGSLARYFDGRDVSLLYDHDEAGQSGTSKAVGILQESAAKSVSVLDWSGIAPDPEDLNGYDVHDYVTGGLANSLPPSTMWETLRGACTSFSSSEIAQAEPQRPQRVVETREEFAEVVKAYRERLHLTENMIDGLGIMFATAFSGRIYGDPLWLFVVGPPGSGKTTAIKSFKLAPECCYTSTFKAVGLVSGQEGHDPSLIAQWPGQAVFVKDFTAVKSLPAMEQEEIYGILRDVYDGHFHRQYGNGVVRDYPNCYFSLVAGITDVIHGDHRAELGERFLKYDWIRGSRYDPSHQMRAAIAGMDNEEEGDLTLCDAATSFMQRPFDYEKTPKPPAEMIERIIAMCQIVALLRTRHASGPGSKPTDPAFRLRPEVGTRLAKQLTKLGRCLCFVHNRRKWDEEIYRLLHKVALDTAHGYTQELFYRLAQSPCQLDNLVNDLRISVSTCKRRLEELLEIGAITRTMAKSSGPGRPSHTYSLTTDSLKLYRRSQP